MTTLVRHLFALLFLFAAAVPGARAETATADERTAIQSMISSQIEAFRRDDGVAAYSFASPMIQELFPTVEQFMAMVRGQYQPVYRPQSVTFGEIVATDTGYLQKVYLVGPDGQNYVAVYSMLRQPDGSWRINGCALVKDEAEAI
jgi:hypothetical protein